MNEDIDKERRLRMAELEAEKLPLDIGNIRHELAARSVMATFDWRIRSGVLTLYMAKQMPWWLFGIRRSHIKIKFGLVVESASGLVVGYPTFTIFVRREKVGETIAMVQSICQSNVGALRSIDHANERIRQLAYIKQTDFREVPIALQCVNDRTGEIITGIGNARRNGHIGVPAFMRNPNDLG